VRDGRVANHPSNQIVAKQRREEFLPHHGRRFASQVFKVQRLLDLESIEFHIPSIAVQFRDRLGRVFVRVQERRDDRDLPGSATWHDDIESNHAQRERLGDRRVSRFVHPRWPFRSMPRNEPIVLAQSLAASEIARAPLVQSGAGVDAAKREHCQRHVRTVVSIEDRHVAGVERTE
jgi:hypothetical protein